MLGLSFSVRPQADQMTQMNRNGRDCLSELPISSMCRDEKESGRDHSRSDGRVPKIRGRDDVGLESGDSSSKGLTEVRLPVKVTVQQEKLRPHLPPRTGAYYGKDIQKQEEPPVARPLCLKK